MICVGGILDRIQSPEDLKKLNLQEMEQLCKELRRFLLRAGAGILFQIASGQNCLGRRSSGVYP